MISLILWHYSASLAVLNAGDLLESIYYHYDIGTLDRAGFVMLRLCCLLFNNISWEFVQVLQLKTTNQDSENIWPIYMESMAYSYGKLCFSQLSQLPTPLELPSMCIIRATEKPPSLAFATVSCQETLCAHDWPWQNAKLLFLPCSTTSNPSRAFDCRLWFDLCGQSSYALQSWMCWI